jgi:hypothetical protein
MSGQRAATERVTDARSGVGPGQAPGDQADAVIDEVEDDSFDDMVDEWGRDSFPASDPPSTGDVS